MAKLFIDSEIVQLGALDRRNVETVVSRVAEGHCTAPMFLVEENIEVDVGIAHVKFSGDFVDYIWSVPDLKLLVVVADDITGDLSTLAEDLSDMRITVHVYYTRNNCNLKNLSALCVNPGSICRHIDDFLACPDMYNHVSSGSLVMQAGEGCRLQEAYSRFKIEHTVSTDRKKIIVNLGYFTEIHVVVKMNFRPCENEEVFSVNGLAWRLPRGELTVEKDCVESQKYLLWVLICKVITGVYGRDDFISVMAAYAPMLCGGALKLFREYQNLALITGRFPNDNLAHVMYAEC